MSTAILGLYDETVGDVYRYFWSRCRRRAVAEDLTSEVFMAAAAAATATDPPPLDVAWLMGVARHKLVDHWRREGRERRRQDAVAALPAIDADPWDVTLDVLVARDVLAELGEPHRSALTLRYLDGLAVPEVAVVLERTVHATEAVLVRARRAFRARYEEVDAR